MRRLLAAALAALTIVPPLQACGPYPIAARFIYVHRPAADDESFVSGRLGILQTGLPSSYLVVAYRHLAGVEWTAEGTAGWNRYFAPPPQPTTGVQTWEVARARLLPNERKRVQPYGIVERREGDTVYRNFRRNCFPDAFETATRTLEARIETFGWPSPIVEGWVRAQDQVFDNCHQQSSEPEPLPDSAPALARADRDYQRAAASFYAGRWDEAGRRFWAISEDLESPWSPLGHYLVARTLWRAGRNSAVLWQLDRVLADPTLTVVHEDSKALRRHLSARADRARAHAELDDLLLGPNAPRPIRELLTDHQILWHAGPPSDLDQWLEIMRGSIANAAERAVERWESERSSVWLVAALASASEMTALPPALTDAADALPQDSPAYPTVAFYRAHLLALAGDRAEARLRLDHLVDLANERGWAASDRNRLSVERARLAETLEEMLEIGQIEPVEIGWLISSRRPLVQLWEEHQALLPEGARYLSRSLTSAVNWELPPERLARAIGSGRLEPHLARHIGLALWTRSVVLEDWEGATLFDEWLEPLLAEDEAKPGSDSSDAARRRFEAALFILRHPGLSPYVREGVGRLSGYDRRDQHGFNDNWWCGGRVYPGMPDPVVPPLDLEFVDELEASEMSRLSQGMDKLDAAPILLGRWVLDYAEARPDDPRLAEALHRVVWSTRWGCAWEVEKGPVSKAAFDRLHRDHPGSEWTAKTPHWFN